MSDSTKTPPPDFGVSPLVRCYEALLSANRLLREIEKLAFIRGAPETHRQVEVILDAQELAFPVLRAEIQKEKTGELTKILFPPTPPVPPLVPAADLRCPFCEAAPAILKTDEFYLIQKRWTCGAYQSGGIAIKNPRCDEILKGTPMTSIERGTWSD